MISAETIKAVRSYNDYIRRHGINPDVVSAYGMAARTAIEREKDVEHGLPIARSAKLLIEELVKRKTGGMSMWDLEKYSFKTDTPYELLDDYYDMLLFEAQNHNLDSYLQYIERKRIPNERFFMPKRKQFQKIGVIRQLQAMLDDECDILCISMPPGSGKAQPLYSKVLTPKGFIRMGDVKVGTKVISGEGNVCKVTGVYPQGKKPVYEVVFDDGSKCRCSDEHLWTVQTRDDRRRKKQRTIPLKDMLGNLRVEHEKRLNYSIQYVPRIEFKEREFFIHPYVMGALLGNGGFTSGGVAFSSMEGETIDRVYDLLPDGYKLLHHDRCSYRIKGHQKRRNGGRESAVVNELKRYGLYNHKSGEKFIPKDYLNASYEQRYELLRGLLDTDGYACNQYAEYCTVSPQLAEDVAELVHSLGGYVSTKKKKAGYKDKDGNYVQCQDAYTLIIQFDSEHPSPFASERKASVYRPKRKEIKRFIKEVNYIGEEECQCIMIDDPCHLYITDDYIITHNTTLSKFFISGVIGWYKKDFNLFFSHSADIDRMYYDGCLDIVSNAEEYAWKDVFPKLKVTSQNAKMQTFNVGSYKPFQSLQCTSRSSNNAGVVRASKFLMVDDLVAGIEEALNKNILDKLWNVYSVDARQRKIDGCKEIHIATRWSVHDVIGRIQRLYPDNPRVRFLAVPDIDPETGESNFDYEFDGFTASFFHDQELAMDDISYKCLYKQEPIEREGLLYHDEELKRYLTLPEQEPDAIWGICDVKNKGTDFMFLPCVKQYGDEYYLTDCVCDDSSDFGYQEDKCANLIHSTGMQQCQFESNAGGDRFAENVNKKLAELGGRCNITTKPTETNKETKIIVNADWIKKHVIFRDKSLYTPKSDYGTMMNWLVSYSIAGKNVHDDVPDGLAMLALFVTAKARVVKVEAVMNPFMGLSSRW